ncbi:zinc finger protein 883-like [Chrysoperla carnea]|uniref:zinc finger protein 883-like n=1 Tax=Chrysoperla carnea TaxID=189513 RepID=UPI001D0893EC|nr:zinc finger protein 883-like [Chrysoperla carnea]
MENFENICRTCSLQGELHPIFHENTADMLSDIIDIKVIKGDNFPQNICTFCLEKLNSAYNFKKQCKDIHRKFEEIIKVNLENLNGIKEEIVVKSEDGAYVLVDDAWNEDWTDNAQNSPEEEDHTNANDHETKDNDDKDTVGYRECKICKKVLKRGSYLRHHKLHIGDRRFICDTCGKSFMTGYKLKIHKRLHSDETPYKCKHCENSYKGDENLLHHMKIKHPEELLSSDTKRGKRNLTIYKCEFCNEEYLVKAYYERHLRTHAIEPPYPCPHPLCDRGYFSRYELKVHSSIHSEDSPYKCLYCSKTFKLKRNQYFHMRFKHLDLLRYNATDSKSYECEICNRKFKSQLNYNQHKVVHTENSNKERPFLCSTCGRSFTIQASLYNHQEKCLKKPQVKKSEPKVTENGKFECEDCGRVYQHKHTLLQHQKVHSKNYKPKSFLCNYCAKSFCSKASLETHINTHTGAKPYKCVTCGRAFAQHAALNTHQRVHTGEKPYKCEICGREFAFKVPFKYHALVHTGEKPHECSICGRRFALNGNLTVHMRTHTGETPYVCSICNKGFYNSNNLKKHKKKHVKESSQ